MSISRATHGHPGKAPVAKPGLRSKFAAGLDRTAEFTGLRTPTRAYAITRLPCSLPSKPLA
jgi:hypothetical protein